MNTTKRRWLTLLSALALVALVLAVRIDRARGRADTPTVQSTAPTVRTTAVRWERVERRITVEARVEADHAADLAPDVSGRVVERLVEPGDAVRRGQPLLRLEDATLAAEVAGRAAELAAARARAASAAAEEGFADTTLSRERTLFAGGAVSREALDRAEVGRDRAAASREAAERQASAAAEALQSARELLADTVVRSPWDGEVVSVEVAPGDFATAGRPVARLVREGEYRVVAHLPQEAVARLTPGSPVVVTHGGADHPARVSRVAAGLGPSGLAAVEADLPARPAGLADGSSVRLSLVLSAAEGLTVPTDALLVGAGGTTVFRLDTGGERPRLVAVPVTVRQRGSDRAVVEGTGTGGAGLEPGDRVVAEHPSVLMTLASGMEVRPAASFELDVLEEAS